MNFLRHCCGRSGESDYEDVVEHETNEGNVGNGFGANQRVAHGMPAIEEHISIGDADVAHVSTSELGSMSMQTGSSDSGEDRPAQENAGPRYTTKEIREIMGFVSETGVKSLDSSNDKAARETQDLSESVGGGDNPNALKDNSEIKDKPVAEMAVAENDESNTGSRSTKQRKLVFAPESAQAMIEERLKLKFESDTASEKRERVRAWMKAFPEVPPTRQEILEKKIEAQLYPDINADRRARVARWVATFSEEEAKHWLATGVVGDLEASAQPTQRPPWEPPIFDYSNLLPWLEAEKIMRRTRARANLEWRNKAVDLMLEINLSNAYHLWAGRSKAGADDHTCNFLTGLRSALEDDEREIKEEIKVLRKQAIGRGESFFQTQRDMYELAQKIKNESGEPGGHSWQAKLNVGF